MVPKTEELSSSRIAVKVESWEIEMKDGSWAITLSGADLDKINEVKAARPNGPLELAGGAARARKTELSGVFLEISKDGWVNSGFILLTDEDLEVINRLWEGRHGWKDTPTPVGETAAG